MSADTTATASSSGGRGSGHPRVVETTGDPADPTDTTAAAATAKSPLDRLLFDLGVPVEELHTLTDALVARAARQLGLSVRDCAQVELLVHGQRQRARQGVTSVSAIPATGEAMSLAQHFGQEKQARMYPWKVSEERAQTQIAHMQASIALPSALETLQGVFEQKCKAHLLSATEVSVLGYVLYPQSCGSALALAYIMLMIPPEQRMELHNWGMAASLDNAERLAYGHAIEQLTATATPLFPTAAKSLAYLNTQLLGGGGGPKGGGSGGGSSLFRGTNPGFAAVGRQPVGAGILPVVGAGVIPVLQGSDGAYGVDVTPIEVAYNTLVGNQAALTADNERLRKQIVGCERKIVSLGGTTERQGRGSGDRGRGAQQQRQPQQQYQQQYLQPYQQQQQQQHQSYQRGRGRGARGGEAEDWASHDQQATAPPPSPGASNLRPGASNLRPSSAPFVPSHLN